MTEREVDTDPAPPYFPEEEEPTGVVCLACGALAQRLIEGGVVNCCPHCTSGIMTADQVMAWKTRKLEVQP